MTPAATDALIRDLADDLRPVVRLRPPWVRAAAWLAVVVAVAALLAITSDLPGIAARLRAAPDMWMAVAGAAGTAVLGAIAVFELSLPDRRSAWALLPLPAVALWVGASGWGCLRSWAIPEVHPASMRETGDCIGFIVGLSVPLSVLLVVMIRRACPLRPNLTALVGGLTAAAASATLLTFLHPYDASASDLALHALAVAIVMAANRFLGGRLLTSPAGRPRGVGGRAG